MSHSAYIKTYIERHKSLFVYITPGDSLTKQKFERNSLDVVISLKYSM